MPAPQSLRINTARRNHPLRHNSDLARIAGFCHHCEALAAELEDEAQQAALPYATRIATRWQRAVARIKWVADVHRGCPF